MAWRAKPVVCLLPLAFGLVTLDALAARATRTDPMAEWKQRLAGYQQQAKSAGSAAERDTAIQHMDQLLQQCAHVRGCDLAQLLPTYREAVAAVGAPANGAAPAADDEGPDEMIDLPADGVAAAPSADKLLDERNRRFLETVKMNPAVQAGIKRWLTDMRPSLMRSYENFQYLKSSMTPAFQRSGLSEALLFGIIAKESNGKVHVGSRAGAVGPLQFMPATGRRFGLGNDGTGFDTRYDPKLSSEAAAAYLRERFAELNNSIELSLAAYNGGEGRALRVYQNSGGRSFWDSDVYSQFPAETKDYVPMVIAAAWLYLHPREYGVRWPRVTDTPAQIKLQRPTTFTEMTICMGNARGTDGYLRALRNMNPRYSPDQWLQAGTMLNATTAMARAYSWNCMSGTRATLARELATADPSNAIVRVGAFETIESDRPANMGSDPAMSVQRPATGVAAGVATGSPAPASNAASTARPANQSFVPAQQPATLRTPPSVTRSEPLRPTTYRVQPGDHLTQIARTYGCRVQDLIDINGLKAPNYTVQPGQVLKLEGCGN